MVLLCSMSATAQDRLRINQLQFVGSHNSYKQAMSEPFFSALQARNPQAAAALAYEHIPLSEQLNQGVRKLELDVFYDASSDDFVVGHVQQIDMNSHCSPLSECLRQVRVWSDAHPTHVPIWISFNAKDQAIEGLPTPQRFNSTAFALLDRVLEAGLGDRLIRPRDVLHQDMPPEWPTLEAARGRMLLVLDEGGDKRAQYWRGTEIDDTGPAPHPWTERPMFTNAPIDHPAAAVMIVNDPLKSQLEITRLVKAGYLVRTRADADTLEARTGNTTRRDAAFASGAQAVSTDYYLPAPFSDVHPVYHVEPRIQCNPVNTAAQHQAQCERIE